MQISVDVCVACASMTASCISILPRHLSVSGLFSLLLEGVWTDTPSSNLALTDHVCACLERAAAHTPPVECA